MYEFAVEKFVVLSWICVAVFDCVGCGGGTEFFRLGRYDGKKKRFE